MEIKSRREHKVLMVCISGCHTVSLVQVQQRTSGYETGWDSSNSAIYYLDKKARPVVCNMASIYIFALLKCIGPEGHIIPLFPTTILLGSCCLNFRQAWDLI